MFFLAALTPTPSPTPSVGADLNKPWVVTPGMGGFVTFAVLGLALFFLILSMSRHIRRANFRAKEREAELYGPVAPQGDTAGAEASQPARDEAPGPAGH